jgi:hypothetical protein
MLQLPNRGKSSAILIGTASYQSDLPDIPAVRNNVSDLSLLLTDPEFGAFDKDRCSMILDPSSPHDVAEVLLRETQSADDLLLLYYAGHGLVGQDGELHLGLSETTHDGLAFDGLAYRSVRQALLKSPARWRVVILDCCYSGRAVGFMTSPAGTLMPQAAIAGSFVLTSSSSTGLALARPGDPYTAFTGELIRILKEGIRGGRSLLSLGDIYYELSRTMSALGYPTPQRSGTGAAEEICVARNVAAEDVADVSLLTVDEQQHIHFPSTAASPADEQDGTEGEIAWNADEPSREDFLHRGFVADVVALRLMETHASNPHSSFCAHVDGPWGSGKSTLLGLIEERLNPYFQIVRFDAWQQSRLSPPWWSLLTATRRQIVAGRRRWTRPWLRMSETFARVRRTGGTYMAATVILAAIVAALAYLAWPVNGWADSAKVIPAIIAAVGVLATGSLIVSRFLLWDTAHGARLFERSQDNPLGEVAAHFSWLLARSRRPVVFFIEDLDRCAESYVVELLDTIQTVIRGTDGGNGLAPERSAFFVVAADGAWLRRSYESTYNGFLDCVSRPGRSLGYLFLDKFFQLTIPMPALAGQTQRTYLDRMLHVDYADRKTDEPARQREAGPTVDNGRGAIAERLLSFANGRSQYAIESITDPIVNKRTEHTLSKFAPLLDGNPRTIKRFINTYSLFRSLRTLEGNFVDSNTLALWVILRLRWPAMANHLEQSPAAVVGIVDVLWCSDHFPESLRDLASSGGLREVVTFQVGGPLTPDLIRQCCGIASE